MGCHALIMHQPIHAMHDASMQNLGPSDAPGILRLAMLDAGTYDAATKTGGMAGATILR